jgi:stage II sporulation protein M
MLKLLPHGIFELPAIILALAFGLRIGMFFYSKNPELEFKYRVKNALRVFVFIIVPLLIIAAIIETSLIFLIK